MVGVEETRAGGESDGPESSKTKIKIGFSNPLNNLLVNEDEAKRDDIDEEAEGLLQNGIFIRDFINQIKARGEANLSARSCRIIDSLKETMKRFGNDETVGAMSHTKNLRSTGAIPKIRGNPKILSLIQESEGENDSSGTFEEKFGKVKGKKTKKGKDSDSCAESESSSVQSTPKKRKRKKFNKTLFDSSDSQEKNNSPRAIGKLLKHLDFRSVPKLESFNENIGQNLCQYLEKFEDYCQHNYKGKKYLWINELECHLSGRVLEAFQSLHQFGDGYDEVKGKLLSWYKDEREIRKAKARKKFETARPKPKESLYIFGNRLETLYKIAYPKNNPNSSGTLVQQFKTSVCRKLRDIINSQNLNYKLKGKKLQWREVQQCARLFDLERSMERSDEHSSEEEKPKEIIINVGQRSGVHEPSAKPNRRDYFVKGDHNGQNNVSYQPKVFQNSSRYPFPRQYRAPVPSQNYHKPDHAIRKYRPDVYDNQSRFRTNQVNSHNTQTSQNYVPRFRFQNPPPTNIRTCYFCGRFGHLKANCRLRIRACFSCGEQGHFQRECDKNNGNRFSGLPFRQNSVRSQSTSPPRNPSFGNRRFQSVRAPRSEVNEVRGMSNDQPLVLTREC